MQKWLVQELQTVGFQTIYKQIEQMRVDLKENQEKLRLARKDFQKLAYESRSGVNEVKRKSE